MARSVLRYARTVMAQYSAIRGSVYGLLVGDALGVPYEFHAPSELPPIELLELEPPAGFVRAHPTVAPGTWSDDGAHALCLLASLLDQGAFDADDLGRRLLDWYRDGYMAVDHRVFDVGIQTRDALHAIRSGVPALEAGPAEERTNGNGSLMRVLPLALWHRGSDAELVRDARVQSCVTHGHLRSQLCCALYCLWVRRTELGGDAERSWQAAAASLRNVVAGDPPSLAEIDGVIRPEDPPHGTGSGYVLDCLHSARLAVAAGPYELAIKTAIAIGDDTDTTAAVAGGIAGLRDGIDAIPGRWLDGLRGREMVEPLVERLLAS